MASLYGDAFASVAGIRHCGQVQFDLFHKDRWPRHPYCTDDLKAGIYPRSLAAAIKRKYIQANPPHIRVWSIFDVDRAGAAHSWEDSMLPPPNWATVNVDNGHAHLVYGLSVPVLIDSPDMRQAPLRFLSAVEYAYREALGADRGYSGLMTKNPAHPLWRTLRGPNKFYDLNYLSEFVQLKKFIPRGKFEEVGLIRNVRCFDFLRHWAYQKVREYKGGGLVGWNSWLEVCYEKALLRNGEFKDPLDPREVWHISKSVAKWTWSNFDIDLSDQKFSELQRYRGHKGGVAKGANNEVERASAILMASQGMSVKHISEQLGFHRNTISNWLCTNSHNQITAH